MIEAQSGEYSGDDDLQLIGGPLRYSLYAPTHWNQLLLFKLTADWRRLDVS
jgi:hypothetical protein